ncbi:MAG TPA: 2-phospho-L-lactate transferase [Microthrixaceae bacterium]|nr:2-phospho-L-lactate transferase [Microthrixaceae bacterium]
MGDPIAVIAGGVGAARFLLGLLDVVGVTDVTAVVNVGDDTILHGLMISPDLDTVTYTLAGQVNPVTGWGLQGETWQAMGMVQRYAESAGIDSRDEIGNDAAGWFALGDLDLGTHMYRTSRLRAGIPLSTVTAEIARTWDLGLHLIPATDGNLSTRVTTQDGRELSFQEYFVREHHEVAVTSVEFIGAESCTPAPGVIDAISSARCICIAPSNPVVSIDPILAVPSIREAIEFARDRTVAISPIVGGRAIKGPAERLLRELGHEPSVVGIARYYAPLASTLVIDTVDAELAPQVEAEGMACVVTDTIMSDPDVSAALARTCISAVEGGLAR